LRHSEFMVCEEGNPYSCSPAVNLVRDEWAEEPVSCVQSS